MDPYPLDTPPRRLRKIAIAAAVFFVLAAIGRYATLSAAPSLSSASAEASLAPSSSGVPADSAGPSFSAINAPSSPSIDDATVGDVSAVESLPDGAVIVDINRASEDDLRRLPGIGPVRARAILALRARLGRFKGVDDLVRIKGIGRAMLRRLRPLTRAP